MGLSLSISLNQSLQLTAAQKLTIKTKQLSLRLELMRVVRDEVFTPTATCTCGYGLKPIEIIAGFTNDPADVTTLCPRCKNRFEPQLTQGRHGSTISMPFYCAIQTLDRLKMVKTISPDELKRSDQGLYHSAIVHFGNLQNAFGKINVVYNFTEILDWSDKIKPFLGELPDVTIAHYAGVQARNVSALRRQLNIPRYRKEVSLDE
jgi:hypothetical protein